MNNNISRDDAIYMAGIVDGEGCITINEKQRTKKGTPVYSIYFSVTNTNKDLLIYLWETTHLGSITPKNRTNIRWKPCHQWILTVDEVKKFLPVIFPFLKVRKRLAELVMEFISLKRYAGPHYPLTLDEQVARELIYEEVRDLNKRGA